MDRLFRFTTTHKRDPAVTTWLDALPGELGAIARHWFAVLRSTGPNVRELMHDGCATACVDNAAFAYVNVFKAHASIGFFHGADLADPAGLLEGSGKYMRHVKLRPGVAVDTAALHALVKAAYLDMQQRLD